MKMRVGSARSAIRKAADPEQMARVGYQAGGRVFLFLHTDDFHRDRAVMTAAGVRFVEEPREEAYGTVPYSRISMATNGI